ncbi:MAG: YvcK family protein, partial [Chloroflexi bacterium]|nr:YvcK family protein [Chloroflexota bacterium]
MKESSLKPKILVIGGGSGSSNILRGLKRYPVELTVIVTMFDSGGSSGLLRKEFGYPPFGDLRQCLMALSDDSQDTQRLKEALEFRFGTDSSLKGHSVGNLLLAALTSLSDNLELALHDISRLLGVTGQVIPVTLETAELCAELDDGRLIVGESDIDLRFTPLPRIKKIFLNREVEANPRAIQAILDADAIVFGPGDLYTSILPNTLPKGIVDAVASSKGIRIYMCNLMTKQGETDGFKASDFTRTMTRYLNPSN